MAFEETLLLGSRLFCVGFATFCSILLWSRTRETAWILLVSGTIASYGEILFSLLVGVGIISTDALSMAGVPLGRIVIVNLPWVLFSAAFLVMAAKKRI